MSLIQRSLLPLTLLAVLGPLSCKDQPGPAVSESANPASQQKNKLAPLSPQVKVDPLIAKVYRAEACYYGTISLKAARAAYLGSLGGGEPSATKIPDFGSPTVEAPSVIKPGTPAGSVAMPAASGTPHLTASPSAKPPAPKPAPSAPAAPVKTAPSAAPVVGSAKVASSAAPVGSGSTPEDRAKALAMDRRLRSIPYDRFARSCTVAAGIKVPDSPELDPVMAEYAPYIVQLSKDLGAANMYYQREDFKTDDFAKGKELHGKIVDGFKKLDDFQKKLATALGEFKSKNGYDMKEWSESQKLSFVATDADRDLFLDFDTDKLDPAKLKADYDKADQANAALKKWGEDHKDANDPFVRIVVPASDIMLKQSKEMMDKTDLKAPIPSDLVALTTYFTRVLEANNRSVTRLLAEREAPPALQGGQQRLPEGHPGMPMPAEKNP